LNMFSSLDFLVLSNSMGECQCTSNMPTFIGDV
jgi:hypothetical protein